MSDLTVDPEDKPKWLTSQFLRDCLSISGDVKIKNLQYACAIGDNFASKIYRVELVYDDTTQWLIVKSRPCDGGFSEEFVKKFGVFAKEIEMYEYVDRFEELFRALGSNVTFSPKCLKVTDIPTDILIIDDLNAKGFRMAKKSEGLSVPEMKMALNKLAKFHAASAVYCENYGAYAQKFTRGIYNVDMKEIFESSFDANFGFVLNEFFSTWPGLDKRIVDKMKQWRKFSLLDELVRTMTSKPDQFNCLTHGDAWLANILFQYDENKQLVDCQFIDFQQSVYTSPAIDLISLIFTSAKTETKLQNFEFFVQSYHEQLVEALTTLNYCKKIPTLKELYLDVLDRGFLAVWHGFAVLPTCLAENIKESSTDNLLGENEAGRLYKEKIYNNDRYRKHMTELLTYFNMRGLVDLR